MSEPPELPSRVLDRGADVRAATGIEIVSRALLDDAWFAGRVEVAETSFVSLVSPRGRIVLIAHEAAQPTQLRAQLKRLREAGLGPVHVAVVGGPKHLRTELGDYLRNRGQRSLRLYHVDASGELWQNRRPPWWRQRFNRMLGEHLRAGASARHWTSAEVGAHARRLAIDQAASRREHWQVERFRESLDRRAPRATLTIACALVAVFSLQWLWGGVDLPPLLAHMGSLVPERARGGEWWRFLACTFLHGGTMHLALNVLVLFMLGRFLERFLGAARFLLIYFASALAGSLASSCFVTSQSVGASGAIWGLLGAEVALAFYPRALLPPVLLPLARRTALVLLALCVVNSFNPHVDLAAHVGGGSMGVLVCCTFAALGQLSEAERARSGGPALRCMAAVLAIAFSCGVVVAQVAGRPWQLAQPPALERVRLGQSDYTAELPAHLSPLLERDSPSSTEFGNLAYDPCVVDITLMSSSPRLQTGDAPHELLMIQRLWATPDAALEVLRAPRLMGEGARAWVTVRQRYTANPDIVLERVVGLRQGVLLRVDVIGWAALPASFEDLAARILQSFEPVAGLQGASGASFRGPGAAPDSRRFRSDPARRAANVRANPGFGLPLFQSGVAPLLLTPVGGPTPRRGGERWVGVGERTPFSVTPRGPRQASSPRDPRMWTRCRSVSEVVCWDQSSERALPRRKATAQRERKILNTLAKRVACV